MLVKDIPPVPEGFDPDSVQFGVPPSYTCICRLSVGQTDSKWLTPVEAIEWHFNHNHIYCLPLKPWYRLIVSPDDAISH